MPKEILEFELQADTDTAKKQVKKTILSNYLAKSYLE